MDVGGSVVGEGRAEMGGDAAVLQDAHVSRLYCVVVVKGGASRLSSVCHRRRARAVLPHLFFPSPALRAHTNRVTGHETASGAETWTCSAAAASGGVEARMYILAHRRNGRDRTKT